MKPVLILANNVEELGGAQVVAHTLARLFTSRSHQCSVVGVTPHAQPHDFGGTETTALMSRIWPLAVAGDQEITAVRTQLRAEAVRNLAGLLNASEPGVVIAAQLWAIEILIESMGKVPRREEWRIVGQYHGAFAAAANSRDLKRAVKLAPKCDLFAVLTQEDAQAFADCGLTNVITVPNPRTWSATSEFARSPKKYIDFIGRFSPEKGADLALAGFECARGELGSDWTLRMIGSGPLAEQLHELAGPQVKFVAPLTGVEPILSESGVLLLTSRTEGTPLVVAEALAAGVPVIAADCSSGIRELFKRNREVYFDLIARENPAAIAQALIRFAQVDPIVVPGLNLPVDSAYENWLGVFASL